MAVTVPDIRAPQIDWEPPEGAPPNSWFAYLRKFAFSDKKARGPLPDLDKGEILSWADAFRGRTGFWPNCHSGLIPGTQGETWLAVEAALHLGLRGFRGNDTLARFLARHRGRRNLGALPPLTLGQILAWADAHHQRTGKWPLYRSGAIEDAAGETWLAVDMALRKGRRLLPGGTSLARVLEEHRGVRNKQDLPPLRVRDILAWAIAHHKRTGRWPTHQSGPIPEAPGETWSAVQTALYDGVRGFPGGSSLARLLRRYRKVVHRRSPRLTIKQILAWADAYHQRTGCWPSQLSGESWPRVDQALLHGFRGLPGGSSLSRLLARYRGARRGRSTPRLTEARIRFWAEAHRLRTGRLPHSSSGPITESDGLTWHGVNRALKEGLHGLPGGSSLAQLLGHSVDPERVYIGHISRPPLAVEQVLAWADAHHARTGSWPTADSGVVVEAPEETWRNLSASMRQGCRGFPKGGSLARLLAEHRGVRNVKGLPPLTAEQILTWARAHRERTGRWPRVKEGPIPDAPGEIWAGVERALSRGLRGFPGGSSLARFLEWHG